jgi:hypothetical protein
MSLYSLSSGDSSPQYTPPPSVKETSVFDGWQDFLGGLTGAIKGTAQAVADTVAAVNDAKDSNVSATTVAPKKPEMSPIVAIALGIGLAYVAKKVLFAKGD